MDANKNVYRYISFENFVDVVINERLTLVSPLSFWEDTYEGWLFRMLQQKYPDSQSNQFPQNALHAIQLLGKTVVAQCWTKNCDSVAMWSIYSYSNKAVMIKTRQSKLVSINGLTSFADVEYNDTKQTAKDELRKMMRFNHPKTGLGLFTPFIRKRSEFAHENEVRVFAVKDGPINTNSKGETLEINIAPVSEFIEGVMVHPLATDWYVNIVHSFCDRFHIMFDGRSELYQLKIEPYETILPIV